MRLLVVSLALLTMTACAATEHTQGWDNNVSYITPSAAFVASKLNTLPLQSPGIY